MDEASLLQKACPDLQEWPMTWRYDDSDIAPGTAIVALFKPFLLKLLGLKLSRRVFNRHRDNLWLVGGELIRRRQEQAPLRRLPTDQLIERFIDEDGGPLISSTMLDSEQDSIDGTCRKLHKFLNTTSVK